MPSETEEIWRYSGIDRFDLDRFAPGPVPVLPDASLVALARQLGDSVGPRSALVVTVDGGPPVVEGAAPGLVVAGLASRSPAADEAPPIGDVVRVDDAFGELHDALLADAVVVTVDGSTRLEAPVVVVHLITGAPVDGHGPAVFPHTAVHVGRGAAAGVVEVVTTVPVGGGAGPSVGSGPVVAAPSLVVPVTELTVGDGAQLAYASLQLLDRSATHVGVQASRVGRDATLRSMAVASGGAYARLRTDAAVTGAGGSSALLAAYLATGDQVLDFRTTQEHVAPHTQSELLFTGAVADRSRSVYSGLIRIHRGARGTSALQTNHNLVLSEGARADSVPNLDIEEHDVRCSHASTVGPIDEEQRYYLESRGIEPAVAERLIVAGFFAALAARSPFPGVGDWIERTFEARLAGRLAGASRDATARAGSHG